MACRGCGKNKASQPNTQTVTYSEAVKIRNERQGYVKTTVTTRGVTPLTKSQIRSENKSLLTGK